VQNNCAGSPAQGQQFVELDSDASSSIYQDVSTVPGEAYQLRFAFSARPGLGTDENHLLAQWDGGVVANLTADGTALSDTSWTYYTYTVVASSGTTRLQFSDLGISDSLGTYLDDVSLVALHGPVAAYQVGAPASVNPGQPFALTVTPVDAYGNPFPDYLSGLRFSSSDPHAVLPGFYDFTQSTPSSSGAYTIPGFALPTVGTQSIQVADENEVPTTASATIQVANPTLSVGSDGFANIGTPFVRQGSVSASDSTLMLTVNYGDGSPVQGVSYDQNGQFTLSHTYEKDGSFPVTVTASNGHGATAAVGFFAAGANVTLTHDSKSPVAAFVIVASVPEQSLETLANTSSLTDGTQMVTSFDVRAINVTSEDVAIITFHYDAPSNALPSLSFYDETTSTLRTVDSSLYLVDAQDHTITLRLDRHSTPKLPETRGTVFSIAVPLPAQAPAATDPSLPASSESRGSQVALTATSGPDGGQRIDTAEVTGGSTAAGAGQASGGGQQEAGGGGAQDSTALGDLPPAPPMVPSAVGTVAVPTIELPPQTISDVQDGVPLSLGGPILFPQWIDQPAEQPVIPALPTAPVQRQFEAEPRSVVLEEHHEARPASERAALAASSRAELADLAFTRLAEEEGAPPVLAERRTDLVLVAAFLAGVEPWKWASPPTTDQKKRSVRSSAAAS
jgi:hypothetical protein